MRMTRDDAVAMFNQIGYRTAKKWNKVKIRDKFIEITEMALVEDSPELADLTSKDARLGSLYAGVIEAVEKGEDIEVVGGKLPKESKQAVVEDVGEEDEGNDEGPPAEVEGEFFEEDDQQCDGDEKNEVNGGPPEEVESQEDASEEENPTEEEITVEESLVVEEASKEKSKKKKRGRPRKERKTEEAEPKKKRGRPKKEKVIEEEKPKAKKEKTTRKRGVDGPPIEGGNPVGIRSIRNRLFCAGVILRDRGLTSGLSDDLIEEVDKLCGKSNNVASKTQLGLAWHVVNGYLNGNG